MEEDDDVEVDVEEELESEVEVDVEVEFANPREAKERRAEFCAKDRLGGAAAAAGLDSFESEVDVELDVREVEVDESVVEGVGPPSIADMAFD